MKERGGMIDKTQPPFLTLPRFGTDIGLHRVRYLINYFAIDVDDISKKSLVVTGSNGKGSTSRIASELLKAFGLKTGLFTSPHLYQYNERFQIDGKLIDDETLLINMAEIMYAIDKYEKKYSDKVGAFEAQYVLAIKWFSESKVDYMVLEAGIGGRFDPVRTAKSKVGGLISLDLEHTELLGETLQEIALDKMDACDNGGTLICGESCHKVKTEVESYAWLKELNVKFLSAENWKFNGITDGYQDFDIYTNNIKFKNLKSRLVGEHQLNNHAVAIELCHELLRRNEMWDQTLAEKQWPKAIADVYWPGRLEKIYNSPSVYIDVGHTPDGIRLALDGFKSLTSNQPALLVIGGSYNKKCNEIAELLAASFGIIICTTAYHKGMNTSELEKYVRASNPNALIYVEPTIETAVKKAIDEATKHGLNIYVAGGLFLAIEFAHTIRGENPQALKFF